VTCLCDLPVWRCVARHSSVVSRVGDRGGFRRRAETCRWSSRNVPRCPALAARCRGRHSGRCGSAL